MISGYNIYIDGVKKNTTLITTLTYNMTSLLAGTNHAIEVGAVDDQGLETKSSVSYFLTKPGQVTGVEATPISSTAVYVSWIAVTGAANYKLERKLTSGSSWISIATGVTTLSFNDNQGLSLSTSYDYRIKAVNETGESLTWSTTVSATTLAASTIIKVTIDGDSMSTNYADTSSLSYPEIIRTSLVEPDWTGFENFAVPGQTISQMNSDSATQVFSTFDSAVAKHILLVWGGFNDIGQGSSATTVSTRLQTYITNAVAAGFKVVVMTLTSDSKLTSTGESTRQSVNTWIRNNWESLGCSYLVDLATDYRIGDWLDGDDTTYFVDKIHMNNAGRTIVANMVKQAMEGIAAGNTGIILGESAPVTQPNGIDQSIVGLFELDEGYPEITYTGVWTVSNALAGLGIVGGYHNYSDPAATTASYTITKRTTRIKIRSAKNSSGTPFTVKINGVLAGSNNGTGTTYSLTEQNSQIVWDSGELVEGDYTLLVEMNKTTANTSLYLDAIYFRPVASTITTNLVAPETGQLVIFNNDANWQDKVAWIVSTDSTVYATSQGDDGKGSYTQATNNIRRMRVNARYIDFLLPKIVGAGKLEVKVTNLLTGEIKLREVWDHNSAGVKQKSGYPDNETPQISVDTGVVADYEILFRRLFGGNGAAAMDQTRIRKV